MPNYKCSKCEKIIVIKYLRLKWIVVVCDEKHNLFEIKTVCKYNGVRAYRVKQYIKKKQRTFIKIPDIKKHICPNNDGDCQCDCYKQCIEDFKRLNV